MQGKLKHIELFAGCGGMSLGLEAAGFELYFANELSPMAGETFAYNLLNEDLSKVEQSQKALWIRSRFSSENLKSRLRENPFDALSGKFSDILASTDFEGKLILGDINQLLEVLKEHPKLVAKIKKKDIDLISGGPPCQSFSLAGKREKDNHKNTLPLAFAEICGLIKPKVVLLENVKGITAPFTENGEKYYAWLEVSKAFALQGYVPICMMLNSKYFGVPQNRPRFILMAYREDIFDIISKRNIENNILENSMRFFELVKSNKKNLDWITVKDFKYYDIESEQEYFDGTILPKLSHCAPNLINAADAIDDIKLPQPDYSVGSTLGGYANHLLTTFPNRIKGKPTIQNHEPRKHSFPIQSRFRFYQVIEQFKNGLKSAAVDLLTGKPVTDETRSKVLTEFSKYQLLFRGDNGIMSKLKTPIDPKDVESLVALTPTKKHSQRALRDFDPAPSQLTIPDDLCHYDSSQPRTLTVREMARLQSFPDWFEFRSKVTTGGKMRRFEVPQYTQVGNAVPPLLAKALGETIKNQLDAI